VTAAVQVGVAIASTPKDMVAAAADIIVLNGHGVTNLPWLFQMADRTHAILKQVCCWHCCAHSFCVLLALLCTQFLCVAGIAVHTVFVCCWHCCAHSFCVLLALLCTQFLWHPGAVLL
jgi:cation transport ATPase